jgi:hypothetical protein
MPDDLLFATFEHEGSRYRFFYDDQHETRGSYAYETEEETKAAEDEEIAKLESGEWTVLGYIRDERCTQATHCQKCDGWLDVESCWGIVTEPNSDPTHLLTLV